MKSNFSININNPCSEKWDNMIENGNAKYCLNCQKNVLDFTQFSDKELIDYFTSNKENVCGRLSVNQQNKQFNFYKPSINYSKIFRIIAGLFVLNSFDQLKSQSSNTINQEIYQGYNNKDSVFSQNPIKSSEIEYVSKIFLKITDATSKEQLKKAFIFVTDTFINTQIDLKQYREHIGVNGIFEVNLNYIHRDNFIKVHIIVEDYQRTSIILDLKKSDNQYIVKLEKNIEIIQAGNICVKRKKWWKFWK